MRIALGTDHRGFELKNGIKQSMVYDCHGTEIQWVDVGCFSSNSCDYPIEARYVVEEMRSGNAQLGILLCGTGVGMSIAANRFSGIYAALVWDVTTARLAREHDFANVLVLPADFITLDQACAMVTAWLTARFDGGRHKRRIEQIDTFGGA
jgi:ribose 5-phosphate isomerase B